MNERTRWLPMVASCLVVSAMAQTEALADLPPDEPAPFARAGAEPTDLGAAPASREAMQLSQRAAASPPVWSSSGPPGGYFHQLAIAASDPDKIYAASERGLYRSIDWAESWTKTTVPEIVTEAVEVAPNDFSTVYAGTEAGVYKSDDGGTTWTPRGLSGLQVMALAIHPTDPDTVYAGTLESGGCDDGTPFPPGEISVYKTINGGASWVSTHASCEHGEPGLWRIHDILIDPDDSRWVYVAGENNGYDPGYGNLLRSSDSGASWSNLTVGPGHTSLDQVFALSSAPAGYSPGLVYFTASAGTWDASLYRTLDRFDTWSECVNPYGTKLEGRALEVDPTDPDRVYVGTHSATRPVWVWIESDNDYYTMWGGLPPRPPSSLVASTSASEPDYLRAAFPAGGVYKYVYSSSGSSWSIADLIDTDIDALAVDPSDSDRALAAAIGLGHRPSETRDGGASWNQLVAAPGNLGAVAIDPRDPETILAGAGVHYASQGTVFLSTDGGGTWDTIALAAGPESWQQRRIEDVWIHPSDSQHFLVLQRGALGAPLPAHGLFRSLDAGATWERIAPFHEPRTLAVDPTDPDRLCLGLSRAPQMFMSTNGGDDWTEVTPPGPLGDRFYDIVVDLDSDIFAATSAALWKLDDSGWMELTSFPANPVLALALDFNRSPRTVYAGTGDGGVYLSTDGGASWTEFNDGLVPDWIRKLEMSPGHPKRLYAGAQSSGAWSIGSLTPAVMVLLHEIVGWTQEFVAATSILAADGFEIDALGDVTLLAGHSIGFANGFAVRSGGRLQADTDAALIGLAPPGTSPPRFSSPAPCQRGAQ